jgi:hypothetical protein
MKNDDGYMTSLESYAGNGNEHTAISISSIDFVTSKHLFPTPWTQIFN